MKFKTKCVILFSAFSEQFETNLTALKHRIQSNGMYKGPENPKVNASLIVTNDPSIGL